MSIIGTEFDPRRGEPQALFDAIREEAFVDLPSSDSEVDVFVAFEKTGDVMGTDGEEVPLLRVIDYQVARIDDEYILDAEPHVGSNEYLMAVDDWARNVEDVDSYMWVHRHPDGMVRSTPKDHRMMSTLVTIDFARGDQKKRLFTGGAIIDSFTSIPLHAGEYWPPLYIGVGEIDIPVAHGLLEIAQSDPETPEFVLRAAQWTVDHIHELVALKQSDPDGESERAQELVAEMKAMMDEGMRLMLEESGGDPLAELLADLRANGRSPDIKGSAMLGLDGDGNIVESDLTELPPKIREIFERLVNDIEASATSSPSLGEPFEPPAAKKPSIFDLPELGKEDDGPKINWN